VAMQSSMIGKLANGSHRMVPSRVSSRFRLVRVTGLA
jgi:hypothetical protein